MIFSGLLGLLKISTRLVIIRLFSILSSAIKSGFVIVLHTKNYANENFKLLFDFFFGKFFFLQILSLVRF